jgi:hypothetical protein
MAYDLQSSTSTVSPDKNMLLRLYKTVTVLKVTVAVTKQIKIVCMHAMKTYRGTVGRFPVGAKDYSLLQRV